MELRVLKLGKKRLTREVVRLVMGTHKKAPLYMMRIVPRDGHAARATSRRRSSRRSGS